MRSSILALLLPAVASARFIEANEIDHVDSFPIGSPADAAGHYLIELSPGETRWVTEEDKWRLRRAGQRFMDITDHDSLGSHPKTAASKAKSVFPSDVKLQSQVKPLLRKLDTDRMRRNLGTFTNFHTRYYKSDYGRQSSEWLLNTVRDTIKEAGADKYVSARHFEHPWGQNSIIATIPGRSNSTVVVGAHQDSINLWLPSVLPAPGADDDGSGTVTILEAFRVLLQSQRVVTGRAANTIEFHWYSAEEGGLLGSQAVFSDYEKRGRDVKAMLQQDMTGYVQGTIDAGMAVSMGVTMDYVDQALTAFIKKVIEEYCDIPWVETKCGYACSDHASASKAGYPAAFVIESPFKQSDQRIHTVDDKIEYLSFEHMLQHARMTLGLVYELGSTDFAELERAEQAGEL